MGTSGNLLAYNRGWSLPELDFCWTEGPFAELVFSLNTDLNDYHELRLDCAPYVCAKVPQQTALIFVNGMLANVEILTARDVVSIPLPRLQRGSELSLVIYLPNASCPASNEPANTDDRILGLQVFSIALVQNEPLRGFPRR